MHVHVQLHHAYYTPRAYLLPILRKMLPRSPAGLMDPIHVSTEPIVKVILMLGLIRTHPQREQLVWGHLRSYLLHLVLIFQHRIIELVDLSLHWHCLLQVLELTFAVLEQLNFCQTLLPKRCMENSRIIN